MAVEMDWPTPDKLCRICGTTKALDQFHTRASGRKPAAECKSCASERSRKWHASKGDNRRHRMKKRYADMTATEHEIRRTKYVCKTYGLTPEQYAALLADCGNLCHICGENRTTQRLAVDHCHDSLEVRGLICKRCNSAIGLADESADRLARMIEYLNDPPARKVLAGAVKRCPERWSLRWGSAQCVLHAGHGLYHTNICPEDDER